LQSLDKLLAFQKTLRSLPSSTSSRDSSKGKEKAEEEKEEEKGKNMKKKEETLLGLIDEPQEQEKDWLTHCLTFEKSLARVSNFFPSLFSFSLLRSYVLSLSFFFLHCQDPTAHQKEDGGYTVVDPRADRKQNPLNKHQQHVQKLLAQKKKENW
jgi:hypothetical protein